MTKSLLKYLLPLSMVLLIGFNQLLGHAHNDTDCYTAVSCDHQPTHVAICPLKDEQFIISKSSVPNKRNEKLLIGAAESEVEEYESTFSKRYTESSTFFTAVFCILILGTFFHLKKTIAFWVPFSYLRPYRWYLQLRVIRV